MGETMAEKRQGLWLGGDPRLLAVLVLCGLLVFGLHWLTSLLATPTPVCAFQRHKGVFEKCVADVSSSKVPERVDQQGFDVTNELGRMGVSYLRKEGTCVIFVFESLPPDAIPELVFSPNGFRGLPLDDGSERGNSLVHLEKLDQQWFYCLRD